MELGNTIAKYDVKFTLPKNALFPRTIIISNIEKISEILKLKTEVGDTSPLPVGAGIIGFGHNSRLTLSYPGPFRPQLDIFDKTKVSVNGRDIKTSTTCTRVVFNFGDTIVDLDLIKLRKLRILQDSGEFLISGHLITLCRNYVILTDENSYVATAHFSSGLVSSDKKAYVSSEYDIIF